MVCVTYVAEDLPYFNAGRVFTNQNKPLLCFYPILKSKPLCNLLVYKFVVREKRGVSVVFV